MACESIIYLYIASLKPMSISCERLVVIYGVCIGCLFQCCIILQLSNKKIFSANDTLPICCASRILLSRESYVNALS